MSLYRLQKLLFHVNRDPQVRARFVDERERLVRDYELTPPAESEPVFRAYAELHARLEAARPDVLVVVSPEHWTNLLLHHMPSFCVGLAQVGADRPRLRPALPRTFIGSRIDTFLRCPRETLEEAGPGGHEIWTWITVAAAAGDARGSLLTEQPGGS